MTLELPRGEHLLRVCVDDSQQLHSLAFLSHTPFTLADEQQVGRRAGLQAALGRHVCSKGPGVADACPVPLLPRSGVADAELQSWGGGLVMVMHVGGNGVWQACHSKVPAQAGSLTLPPAPPRLLLQLLPEVQGVQVQTKEGQAAALPPGGEQLLLRCALHCEAGIREAAAPVLVAAQLLVSNARVRAASRLFLLDNSSNKVGAWQGGGRKLQKTCCWGGG